MIRHMAHVIDPKRPHQLAYDDLLTTVFKAFGVPLKEGRVLNRNDMFTKSTLTECKLFEDEDHVHDALPRAVGPIASLHNELYAAKTQNDALRGEITTLQNKLDESRGEVTRLKD
ncbi:hypothetical protein R3W88_029745 [Solanum pinnatisectum]|uniref:Uncharacterized protein n=1 Tax=Solanum pinnatisectum TaxID=50273 RepID=A0AAV9K685_9SOLN|nr:hypothetical protein R3W88_029745 [Solanum pinnatisectum]